jgi:DNA-binding CsgD family transcriptional regulator
MSFFLSSQRLDLLGSALRVMLSPPAQGGPETWFREMIESTCALVNADMGTVIDVSAGIRVLQSTGDPDLLRAYQDEYGALDLGSRETLRRRLEVGHLGLVERVDERVRNPFFTDYVVPNGLKDAFSLNAFTPRGPSLRILLSYFGGRVEPAEVEQNEALLRALAPGFRAAVDACLTWKGDAARLGRVLDGLADALALCGRDGSVAHRNPALAELLSADPEGERVMEAVRAAARAVARVAEGEAAADGCAGEREVRTAAGRYGVRATLAEEGMLGAAARVVVSVRAAVAPRAVPDARLRERFGLTEREVQVARFLSRGLPNAEMARQMFVSPHTARHHTERVLRKLGVTARAQVAEALNGA